MKITPLEIRQKTFEKHFRGYDKDEVNAFLQSLSQEWERANDEAREMKIKLESAEREVMKLREVETSLFKTLKTAEDTGANVIEQARQAADLHLKESQLRAEALISEAKTKAKNTIEEAELRARQILAEMEERLKDMAESYKKLESHRDDMLSQLKHISQDTLDRVERVKNSQRSFDIDHHVSQARSAVKKVIYPNHEPFSENHHMNGAMTIKQPEPVRPEVEPDKQPVQEFIVERAELLVETETVKVHKSFFDEIG